MGEVGVTPMDAPDEVEYLSIDFEEGIPTAVNGERSRRWR
jgi:argininosuccinate synthase